MWAVLVVAGAGLVTPSTVVTLLTRLTISIVAAFCTTPVSLENTMHNTYGTLLSFVCRWGI
jgi:hypothetical protein